MVVPLTAASRHGPKPRSYCRSSRSTASGPVKTTDRASVAARGGSPRRRRARGSTCWASSATRRRTAPIGSSGVSRIMLSSWNAGPASRAPAPSVSAPAIAVPLARCSPHPRRAQGLRGSTARPDVDPWSEAPICRPAGRPQVPRRYAVTTVRRQAGRHGRATGVQPPSRRDAASASMTTAMTASSTRQAPGRRNTGVRARAPKPRAVNQVMLARPAPRANHHRPGSPCALATEPTRSTVSRYTCGFSQVNASAAASTAPALSGRSSAASSRPPRTARRAASSP